MRSPFGFFKHRRGRLAQAVVVARALVARVLVVARALVSRVAVLARVLVARAPVGVRTVVRAPVAARALVARVPVFARAVLSRVPFFARVVAVAVVLFGVGAGTAGLALLAFDPRSSAAERGGAASSQSDLASATAAPTSFVVAQRRAPRRAGPAYYRSITSRRVPASAERGFMPLYREAARTFGVSWRLIASIHRQETAFSTAPGTYRGLNAFGCCAGPMQFNVTNGPVSTWELYRQSFRRGDRPRRYPHRTRSHPSIYDDFDAMMAAGALLRDAGATEALDGGSWSAAYAYYGHDLFGVGYASEVLGRARGWERDGFCLNCPVDETLVARFDDAYGVDARRQLLAAERNQKQKKDKKRKKRAGKASEKGSENPERRRVPRRSRRGAGTTKPPAARAPASPNTRTTTSPRPSTTTTPPPAPTTEAPPQPTPPPPPEEAPCTGLSRLFGCRG